ncbi:hypothetical protein Tco_1011264 [Tanacetum coccineum]
MVDSIGRWRSPIAKTCATFGPYGTHGSSNRATYVKLACLVPSLPRVKVVKKKRNKKKKHQKQVDGVVLNKPSLTLHYRRVDRGNSTKQYGSYVASTSKEGGKSAATSTQSKNVRLENSFSALNDDEDNE